MSEQALEESLDARRAEIRAKLDAARALMARQGVDALHLTTVANTAWITAGCATYVNESVDEAALSVLVTAADAYILTDPIEEPRLRDEERLDSLGYVMVVEPWHTRGPALARLTDGKRAASDRSEDAAGRAMQNALVMLRSTLAPGEQARIQTGARLAAAAMREAVLATRPGMAEHEVAAHLAAASRRRGGTAIVALVGSDERISRYRHPLPTAKAVEHYAMLVLCFRYRGLVTALTRSIHYGALPETLYETALTIARIDARMITATQQGRSLAEMFQLARQAYEEEGHPDAIERHHQGGPIAYNAREALATPASEWRIESGQAFAWNPSLPGAKSEDTTLLTSNGAQTLTRVDEWPVWSIETPDGVVERPAILTIE